MDSEPKLFRSARNSIDRLVAMVGSVFHQHENDEPPALFFDVLQLEDRILYSAAPFTIDIPEPADVDAEVAFTEVGDEALQWFESTADLQDSFTFEELQPSAASIVGDETTHDSTTADATRLELIFVDESVANYEFLIDDVMANESPYRQFRVIMLDSLRDGVQQVSETLRQNENVDAVHLVTHGTDGQIRLGNAWLSNDNIGEYVGEFRGWSQSLSSNADLLIYGCDLAASVNGQSMIQSLSHLTEADVSASTNDTGHASYGGDWILEHEIGTIETQIAFSAAAQESWIGKMALITVDTTADLVDGNTTSVASLLANRGADGFISLREAILAVNAGSGGDTIALLAGTYTFAAGANGEDFAASGDLDLIKDVTIIGAGEFNTVIDADDIDRVFDIRSGTATIQHLTILDGNSGGTKAGGLNLNSGASANLSNVNFISNRAFDGGAIYTSGNLTLTDVSIDGNTTTGWGGGIFIGGALTTFERVTLSNNTAVKDGGGIYVFNSNASLTNVTISGNSSTTAKGGGIWSNRVITADHVTIAYNSAITGAAGIHTVGSGDVILSNSILYNPTGLNSNNVLSSGGSNIDSDGSAGLGDPLDGVDPMLNALAANGGPTLTHSLIVGSSAIDPGTATGSPVLDQRGAVRDGDPDIGAFEFGLVVNTAPTDISPDSFSIALNTDTSGGSSVGTLQAQDIDAGETFTYSIIGGADQAKFSIGGIGGDELILTDGTIDYNSQSSYDVNVRVTDSFGNMYDESTIVNVIANAEFWFSTIGNGSAGGESWGETEAIQFGGPGLILEPSTGTSAGTLSVTGFNAPANIRGMHMVQSNLTVGGTPLLAGDLLLTIDTNGLPFNEYDFGLFTADRHDIIRFTPNTAGDYSTGTYEMFLDEAIHDSGGTFYNVHALSLIEQQVTVGGTVLNVGDIVVAHSNSTVHDDIYKISVSSTGFGSTVTSDEVLLLRGSGGLTNTGFDDLQIQGLSVLDRTTRIGATTLNAGTILVALNTLTTEVVADNNLTVSGEDIFYLTVSQTEPTATIADATLLVEGADVDLNSPVDKEENINGLTLVGGILISNTSPTDILPNSFSVNENTNTTGGVSIGTLTATDADVGETFTYSIEPGADGTRFSIGGVGGDELLLDDGVLDFESKGSYTVNIRVTDSSSNTYDETLTVNVNDINESPTAITPTGFNVNENTNTSGGFSLGTLTTSDQDSSESFTYTIQGGADAAKFSMGGGSSDELILTDGILDFESKASYTVIVRVIDGGANAYDETLTISVNDINESPTAITPTGFNVNENTNTTGGFSLGTLTTSDQDSSESFTYTIQGGADAAKFSMGGGSSDELILTDGILDFESKASYTVIVRVTDGGGNTYDETLTVNVNDLIEVNTPPTAITPTGFSVNENTNTAAGFSLGTLTTSDVDAAESFTYTIQGGPDAADFSIGGGSNDELILTDGILDFESKATYTVTVRVTDGGGNTYDETLTINVNDLNESPTAITPTGFNVNENTNTIAGYSLGTLTTSDQDSSESFTYTIQGGADAARFSIGGGGSDELILTDGILDFESKPSYTIIVRVTDGGGNTYDETLTVSVNDINELPTAITPTGFNVNENTNTIAGYSLGTLTTIDEDSPESFTYTIQGGVDAANFSMGGASGDELILTDGVLDFESKASYTVIVRVTDGGGNTYDETLTVNVNNVNEPAMVSLTNTTTTMAENSPTLTSTKVADILITDDGVGVNVLSVIGNDAGKFQIVGGNELHLRAGTNLDFESQSWLNVGVAVDDVSIVGSPEDTATMTIALTDINESPVAMDDAYLSATGSTFIATTSILANDTDPEGATVSITVVTSTINGTLTLNANGYFSYVPNPNFVGTDVFIYQIDDGVSAPAQATVTLNIVTAGILPTAGFVDPPRSSESHEPDEESKDSEEAEDELGRVSGKPSNIIWQTTNNPDEQSREQLVFNESGILERLIERTQKPTTHLVSYDSVESAKVISKSPRSITFSSFGEHVVAGDFILSLDELRHEIKGNTEFTTAILGTSAGISASLSVGYVIWLIRGGVLLSSVMSSLPAWQMIDPLPILGFIDDDDENSDDDSLESLVNKSNNEPERTVKS